MTVPTLPCLSHAPFPPENSDKLREISEKQDWGLVYVHSYQMCPSSSFSEYKHISHYMPSVRAPFSSVFSLFTQTNSASLFLSWAMQIFTLYLLFFMTTAPKMRGWCVEPLFRTQYIHRLVFKPCVMFYSWNSWAKCFTGVCLWVVQIHIVSILWNAFLFSTERTLWYN